MRKYFYPPDQDIRPLSPEVCRTLFSQKPGLCLFAPSNKSHFKNFIVMKPIKVIFLVVVLAGACLVTAQAQQTAGKYTVQTRLKEKKGSYEERKLYREFLKVSMKDCPCISHFSVHEALGNSDNHDVVWSYQVDNWNDITQFYAWISQQLKSKNSSLKEAMTPYQPDYTIGGQISMEKTNKAAIAREDHSL
jgi:hypothetical protein